MNTYHKSKITHIASPQNERYKHYLSLTTGKGLKKNQELLLSGKSLTREYLNQFGESDVICVLLTEKMTAPSTNQEQVVLSQELFDHVDVLGTHSPILVLPQPSIEEIHSSKKLGGLNLICPLGDPQNLGATIRSLVAFGGSSVILTPESAHPFLPKSIKSSSGAIFNCKLYKANDIQIFNEESIYALDMAGENLYQKSLPKNLTLIVGEEGPGLPLMKRVSKIKIPMNQKTESLNAGTSVGILFYEYRRQHPL